MPVPGNEYFHSVERQFVFPIEVQSHDAHEKKTCLEV